LGGLPANTLRTELVLGAVNMATNGGIDPAEHGFDAYDNLIAEPTYSNRETGDFGLSSDDPCGAVSKRPTAENETSSHASAWTYLVGSRS
jgi:hypothetical protein